jgi:transcriptional regulator with XRE-family HTH domain
MKRRRAYPTLAAYIEGERVNQTTLAKRAKITQGHLSLIISGDRTPSLALALRLSQIANVPVETLVGKLHTEDVA